MKYYPCGIDSEVLTISREQFSEIFGDQYESFTKNTPIAFENAFCVQCPWEALVLGSISPLIESSEENLKISYEDMYLQT